MSNIHDYINLWSRQQSHQEQQVVALWGLAPCPPPTAAHVNDTGKYHSTTYIEIAHGSECVLFAIFLFFCFSGVQRVTVRGTVDTLLEILPCFRDLQHGATSNTRFVLYYLCSALGAIVSLLSLILDQNDISKGPRIAIQVCKRLFFGAATVLLTIALNHQREHRHTDAMHGDIGIVQLVGQIRKINYTVVVIFGIFVVAELGASFATPTHALHVGVSAVSFVVAVVLNVPIVAAALWIVFHKGHTAPRMLARITLIVGVFLRFIGYIDPSFWNKLLFESWAERNPCAIGGEMSLYDLFEIINLIGQACIFVFVVSEFRRSRSIVTSESALIATANYDDYDDGSSNPSEGDLQRNASF